ncbi:hypothetical protein IBM02_002147 [Listeria monocytogenes]|uniref:Uncharacterized protein n=1 Tax=Listeria monocytogenes TaxID=1639 RepID=A0A5M0YNH7_LISMN|nr:hypothetical protein [Listeria monocytogenes]EAF3882425.1 hypothetical protein [Listeria monocytogenes]EAG6226277.1 hypothetical protein [Listeria monocytogenes]EAG7779465.1 hypothetical protein [Listeria monocytogenes]EAH0316685.1 hypothetical protein [Listeria monocytogenes]EAH0340184.1 hypothetical protein [Listeria monocytogenes]
MKKYIFIVDAHKNLSNIRAQIENLNKDKWVYFSENILVNMTDLPKDEILSMIRLGSKDQLLIVDFNDFSLKNWRNDIDEELKIRGYYS